MVGLKVATRAAPKLKVLISGAGIAGPCLAYWLTRTRLNISLVIIERSTTPRTTGQSVDVRGAAIEIMRRMKLEEEMRARRTTEEGTVLLNAKGRRFAYFCNDDTFTAEYEILRADLANLFTESVAGRADVEFMYGKSIKSLEQHEKNVTVTFSGGEKDTYDLVVAADGSTSKSRAMILSEDDLKNCYTFLGQYLAFFSIPSRPDDPKLWQVYTPPKGLSVMTRPHRTLGTIGAYMCITTPARGKRDLKVEESMSQGPERQKQVLQEYFKDAGWETKRVLEGMVTAKDFWMTRAAQVKLSRWSNGRGVVLGDAAWATFGVGTTLAIQGAYFLAGELSKIKSGDDIPQALLRYEENFRPIYSKMEDLPPGFPQIAFPQTAWARKLRDSVLWFLSKTKLHKLLMSDTNVNFNLPEYEWVDR